MDIILCWKFSMNFVHSFALLSDLTFDFKTMEIWLSHLNKNNASEITMNHFDTKNSQWTRAFIINWYAPLITL